jgi:tetratricopeptide (TPR) repeat protein
MEPWLTLMQYLVAEGKKDQATEEFGNARAKVKPADRAFFVALGHSLLGETDKAIEAFKAANQNEPRVLTALANLYMQLGRLEDARNSFERLLQNPALSDDERKAASRGLALATAADPENLTARKAPALAGTSSSNETPADRRFRAVILGLQKDSDSKREAIKLLEENKKGSNANERFFLAQLYSAVGNRTGVPLVMEELLQIESNRIPLYLRFYSRWLLRAGELSRAEQWIAVLSKKDPEALATAELKARLAAARKDLRGAWEVLRPKVDAPNALPVISAIC